MLSNKSEIDRILNALGEQLAAMTDEPIDVVVCGGSALNALGLISRTTKDVDILALVSMKSMDKIVLETADPLPVPLVRAAQKVARDFDLPENWLNPGPTSALQFGLPAGLLERTENRNYGHCLTVRFLSRYDQIHFKLYAAVDQRGKHYDDLRALGPSEKEIKAAAMWSRTHDVSEGYKDELKNILKSLGFDNVAQTI